MNRFLAKLQRLPGIRASCFCVWCGRAVSRRAYRKWTYHCSGNCWAVALAHARHWHDRYWRDMQKLHQPDCAIFIDYQDGECSCGAGRDKVPYWWQPPFDPCTGEFRRATIYW